MQPSKNNNSIQVRFTKFGYKYQLGKLGIWDDTTAWNNAIDICTVIEDDIKLGRFNAKDNDELFTTYHSLANAANLHERDVQVRFCQKSLTQES